MNTYNFEQLSIIINSLISFQNDPLNASSEDIENLKDYFYYKFADTFIGYFPHKEFLFKRKDFIIGTYRNILYFKSKKDPCITIAIKYDIYIDKVIYQKVFCDKTKCKFNNNKNNFFFNCGII